MDYKYLSREDQKQALLGRLRQYENEHFNHSVNRDLVKGSGVEAPALAAVVEQSDTAMAQLDAAYKQTLAKLREIEAEEKKESKGSPKTAG